MRSSWEVKVGAIIYLKLPRKPKLDPYYEGPFLVSADKNNIQIKKDNKLQKINIKRIKPCKTKDGLQRDFRGESCRTKTQNNITK